MSTLLGQQPALDTIDLQGNTSLHVCAYRGSTECATLLLETCHAMERKRLAKLYANNNIANSSVSSSPSAGNLRASSNNSSSPGTSRDGGKESGSSSGKDGNSGAPGAGKRGEEMSFTPPPPGLLVRQEADSLESGEDGGGAGGATEDGNENGASSQSLDLEQARVHLDESKKKQEDFERRQKDGEAEENGVNLERFVRALNDQGHSALLLSVLYNQQDVAKLLLTSGADLYLVYSSSLSIYIL